MRLSHQMHNKLGRRKRPNLPPHTVIKNKIFMPLIVIDDKTNNQLFMT